MKRRHYSHRYQALQYDVAPGGLSPPGLFLALGSILGAIAGVLFLRDVVTWKWVATGLAVFVLIQVPIAMSDCRTKGTYPGGDICPACGGANRIWPWSF